VDVPDLPDPLRARRLRLGPAGPPGAGERAAVPEGAFQIRIGTPLAEVEQRLLEETLRITKGNKTLAAKMLGIDPKTVFRKLKQGEADEPASGEPSAAR
jgi:two-component system response regulator HydG